MELGDGTCELRLRAGAAGSYEVSIVALAMVPSPAIFAWVGGMVLGMVVNKNLLSTRQQSSLSAASL